MFFLPRHRQPEPLLGLDVHAGGAWLVGLGRGRNGQAVLEHRASAAMAPGWIVDGRVAQFDAVARVLQGLRRQARARTVQVALALPEAAVITRTLTVPQARSPEHLDAMVRAEAGQIIPFPLQEVYLDYRLLGPSPPPTGALAGPRPAEGRVDVLLVAARRERVRDLQALAEAAGLEPVIVDVASFAARRALAQCMRSRPTAGTGTEPTVALFDIGAHPPRWQLLRGDTVLQTSDSALGAEAVPGLPLPQARGLADPVSSGADGRFGVGGSSGSSGPPSPRVAQLAQDLLQAWAACRASRPELVIDAVWLAGEPAGLAGLVEAVAAPLARPCRLLNPFEGMRDRRVAFRIGRARLPWASAARAAARGGAVPDTVAGGLGRASDYLVACGLAWRRFMP